MTESERNQIIFQLNMITGMSMILLNSLSEDELKKIHKERIENRA